MVRDCTDNSFRITAIHDDRDTVSVSWIKGLIIEMGQYYSIGIGIGIGTDIGISIGDLFGVD